jgi:hypothetical protein
MKEPDEVSEVTCEHCPDESEKVNGTLSKAPLTGGRRSRAFEPMTSDRFGFCGEQNFHSILIVVLLQVSKCYSIEFSKSSKPIFHHPKFSHGQLIISLKYEIVGLFPVTFLTRPWLNQASAGENQGMTPYCPIWTDAKVGTVGANCLTEICLSNSTMDPDKNRERHLI